MKLTKQDWREIKQMLQRKSRNIAQISQFYGISRRSIYFYAFKRGWIKKKKKSLWFKIKRFLQIQ